MAAEAEMDDNGAAGICTQAARRLLFFIGAKLLQRQQETLDRVRPHTGAQASPAADAEVLETHQNPGFTPITR